MKETTKKPDVTVFVSMPAEDVERLAELIDRLRAEIAPPQPNCSCHISPPCGDCETWSYARELIDLAEDRAESLRGMIVEGQKAADDFRRWDSQSGSQIRSKIIESFESLPKQPPPRYRTFGEMAARLRDLAFRRPHEVRK